LGSHGKHDLCSSDRFAALGHYDGFHGISTLQSFVARIAGLLAHTQEPPVPPMTVVQISGFGSTSFNAMHRLHTFRAHNSCCRRMSKEVRAERPLSRRLPER
jgi:hypothetical protein